MNCTFLLVLLCVVAALGQEADYPEGEAPRPRNSLLRRGALARNQANKATPSTTTTLAPKEAPVEEPAETDEELEEEIEEEDTVTTTEANRRLKAGVVRPFRSNDDLLAALKRRRAEAANGKTHNKEESASAPAAAESQPSADHSLPNKSNQGRRRYNAPAKSEPAPAEDAAATPKAVRSRFSGRSN